MRETSSTVTVEVTETCRVLTAQATSRTRMVHPPGSPFLIQPTRLLIILPVRLITIPETVTVEGRASS